MFSFTEYNEIFELFKPKELSGIKKHLAPHDKVDTRSKSWAVPLPDAFAKYGFKLLGSGKYASVFGHPTYPYVIKLFMKDAAFLRWVKFCMENKNNKYVPTIRGKVIKITPNFFAIRIEKLTPFKYSQSKEFMSEYDKWNRDNKYVTKDKELAVVLDHFAQNKSLLDLHGDNMMMRGNQVVVIDPYYNWFGKKAPGQYTIDPNVIDKSVF